MHIRYCLPIIKSTKAEVLQTISEQKSDYRYLEVWLDYITDLDEAFVTELRNNLGDALLLLFRRQKLEQPTMSEEKRHLLLQQANGTSSYIDLDVAAQQKDLDYITAEKLLS